MPLQNLIYPGEKSGPLYLLPKRCLDTTAEMSVHVSRQAQSLEPVFTALCLTPCQTDCTPQELLDVVLCSAYY